MLRLQQGQAAGLRGGRVMRHGKRSLLVVLCALAASGGVAAAQTATALVREGDVLAPSGETAANLGSIAIGHNGGYAVAFARLPSITALLWGNPLGGPGGIIREEALIGDLQQTSLEFFFGIADDGRICYSAVCDDVRTGERNLDSVWIDDTLLIIRNQLIPTIGLYSDFNSRPGITADGKPFWHSGLLNAPNGTGSDRALLFDVGMTPLVMSGDPIGGTAEFVRLGNAFDLNYQFSKLGTNWIIEVFVFGTTGSSGLVMVTGQAVMLAGVPMQAGQPVPAAVGGLTGESWVDFDHFGVAESGSWLVAAETDAGAPANWVLVLEGQVALRGGQALADGRTLTGDIEEAYLNEDGDWAATWGVLDGGIAREVLLVNGEPVLEVGDAVDFDGDGAVDAGAVISDFTGNVSLAITDRDAQGRVKVYTTADVDTAGTAALTDDREAFLVVEIDLDGGCACELDGDGAQVDVFDLLAYLDLWFAGDAAADIDGTAGVDVFDLLSFLDCWFPASAGAPCQ